ncbi:Ig-like domain-containing protein [Flavobacterium sp. ASW18X]|uniref:Ig-like domain-containing protein n=1 Tax=Flavobacterium sp. ASW18X TaxID=2572595 RepID=UPI0010ADBD30|nr:Ig-like domain-containing protein [Flavobacterium sp. ASW18X]TKD59109.1 hypothetical protein FBT53_13855 [Flavobacterium sp. ASW18X]
MMPQRLKTYMSITLLFSLISLSCSQDNDEFDMAVEGFINEKGEISNTSPTVSFEAVDDIFSISGLIASSKLNVLANDSIPTTDIDDYQIVAISTATNGEVVVNEDKTITYTPHAEAASKADSQGMLTDEFTYTLEITKNDTNEQKQATVTVNASFENNSSDEATDEMGELLAFPGAVGYGKNSIGGRGGRVIHVTNLNEYGEGSLVAAMEASGPRIVVFDVSGTIEWTKEHYIANPNITIAGESAPSPGITIKGHTFGIRASEVIVRFLRIRVADDVDGNLDGIRIINNKSNTTIENIIVDHCDVSLGTDENLALAGNAQNASNALASNITIQNCFISDGIGENNYAMLIGPGLSKISIIGNGFFNNGNRVPEHTYGDGSKGIEFVNNIIYNYNRSVTLSFGQSEFDSVGNVFKGDADSPPSQADHVYQHNGYENPNGKVTDGKIHQSDNIQIGFSSYGMMNQHWEEVNQSNRVAASDYNPLPATTVVDHLLYDIGASVLFPDEIGETLVREFIDSSGSRYHNSTASAGGVPYVAQNKHSSSFDTDNDGMADLWEITEFGTLNSNSSDDENNDGYTNIEEFFFYIKTN